MVLDEQQDINFEYSCKEEPDEWEIHYSSLTFQATLGEGAFGIVRKGVMRSSIEKRLDVAIKMLKGKLYILILKC